MRPSGIITVLIVLMWLLRVLAWVPIVCGLEYDLAVFLCRDMVYSDSFHAVLCDEGLVGAIAVLAVAVDTITASASCSS